MKTEETNVAASIGLFTIGSVVIGLLLVPVLAWQGYVLSVMWEWFISPAFGLPAPSIPLAVGVALVARLLIGRNATADKADPLWKPYMRAIVGPACTLLAGWIVTKFI